MTQYYCITLYDMLTFLLSCYKLDFGLLVKSWMRLWHWVIYSQNGNLELLSGNFPVSYAADEFFFVWFPASEILYPEFRSLHFNLCGKLKYWWELCRVDWEAIVASEVLNPWEKSKVSKDLHIPEYIIFCSCSFLFVWSSGQFTKGEDLNP